MVMIEEKPSVTMKELVLYTIAISAVWVSSLTFLLPLFITLKVCSWLRAKFFVFVFVRLLADIFPELRELGGNLFAKLKRDIADENPNKRLKFLEIGAGDGANFKYYPENCTLTLLDFNPNFKKSISDKLKKFPNVHVEEFIHASVEDMGVIEDGTFDVVVATHLLCSVSDISQAVKEINRVLKPGGRFAFKDHVAYPKTHIGYWMQKWVKPFWRVYLNGCCPDRNIAEYIKKYFSEVSYETVYLPQIWVIVRPIQFGTAKK